MRFRHQNDTCTSSKHVHILELSRLRYSCDIFINLRSLPFADYHFVRVCRMRIHTQCRNITASFVGGVTYCGKNSLRKCYGRSRLLMKSRRIAAVHILRGWRDIALSFFFLIRYCVRAHSRNRREIFVKVIYFFDRKESKEEEGGGAI